MDPFDVVVRLALGLFIGFTIGLTGIGGGALVLPALQVLVGLPVTTATGTASLYAFVTRIYGAYRHAKLGNVNLKASIYLLVGAVPVCIVVAVWINAFLASVGEGSTEAESFQRSLGLFQAVVVCSAAAYMVHDLVRRRFFSLGKAAGENGKEKNPGANPEWTMRHTLLAIPIGCLAGGLIGATSVGGGVLLIPLLMVLFRISPRKTVGTSTVIALVLTFAASVIYWNGGQLDSATALLMASSAFVGVFFGSKYTASMPQGVLRLILASLVFVSAVLMVVNNLSRGETGL